MAKSKKKMPQLSEDAAQKLLSNVFDACEVQPNTVPLSALESYSEYRRERFSLQKIILGVILLIFLALPFCFISPQFSVTKISPDDARVPQFEVKVGGWFPIKFISANVDGHNVTVHETGERTYQIEPTENGIMDVHVHFSNRQYDDKTVEVSGIDNTAPRLVKDVRDGNLLYLYLEDEGLGIDYDSVRAETLSGTEIKPSSINKEKGLVVFPLDKGSLNIYIPDVKNNVLQLVVTIT